MTDSDLVLSLWDAGLAPGALVLDLGCGTGLQARAMARAGHRVIGVDADVDAVATGCGLEAEAAAAPVWLVARGESLPFRDAVFDAVVCRDVLHWAADEAACRALWRAAWRVLKPGALFHIRCVPAESAEASTSSGPGRPVAPWFPVPRALIEALLADGAGTWASPPRRDGDRLAFTARKPG